MTLTHAGPRRRAVARGRRAFEVLVAAVNMQIQTSSDAAEEWEEILLEKVEQRPRADAVLQTEYPWNF